MDIGVFVGPNPEVGFIRPYFMFGLAYVRPGPTSFSDVTYTTAAGTWAGGSGYTGRRLTSFGTDGLLVRSALGVLSG